MAEYSLDRRVSEIASEIVIKGYTFQNGLEKLNSELKSTLMVEVERLKEGV